jgi:hypothetical protein
MPRESDWHVFDKAVEITASAVRGTIGDTDGKGPALVAGVFREVYDALRKAAEEMPSRDQNTGF